MITPSQSRASSYLDSFETGGGYNSTAKQGSAGAGAPMEDTWRYGSPNDIRQAKYNQAGSRYSGGSDQTASRTTSTKTIRKGTAPEAPELPTFKAPEFNKRAARALTQKMAAPGIRTLRESVQQAMGKNYENPNVRKMTLREALQGYGTGLEKVMSGASREARSEQMAELDLQRQAEMENFRAQTQKAMQSYQNAWQDYLKGSETITESNAASGPASNIQYGRSPFGGITAYSQTSGGRMVPTMTSNFI